MILMVIVVNLSGAIGKIDGRETAYGHRAAPFILNINTVWPNPKDNERSIKWGWGLWSAVQPFSTGGCTSTS